MSLIDVSWLPRVLPPTLMTIGRASAFVTSKPPRCQGPSRLILAERGWPPARNVNGGACPAVAPGSRLFVGWTGEREQMKNFAAIISYVDNMVERRAPFRPSHLDFLNGLVEQGKVV